MKEVQFLHHHGSYNGGEVAGFPDAEASELVKQGVAVLHPRASQRVPATLEELETEVLSRGYGKKAAKQIAQERFDGVFGDGSRYLCPDGGDGIIAGFDGGPVKADEVAGEDSALDKPAAEAAE
jgi:hypothetical protein